MTQPERVLWFEKPELQVVDPDKMEVKQRKLEAEKLVMRELAPGIVLDHIQPGGRHGPNGETRWPTPGGQVWTDSWGLGTGEDDFVLRIPDVRMPANQYYPLHYHGCWIAVIVLDGECLVGDWWMKPGDVLISAADVEYGPLVNGPDGCQMFEIFAKEHLGLGGYAPQFVDHPTLIGIPTEFTERTELNKRNDGRECLPIAEAEGKEIWTGRLDPDKVWDLGPGDDPDRGAFVTKVLEPGGVRAPHSYADAHAIFVMDGEGKLGEHEVGKDDVLLIERGASVPELTAGPSGMTLLEVARTIAGLEPDYADKA